MNMMTTCLPFAGKPVLAPTLQRVKDRARHFLLATGAQIDWEAPDQLPLLTECLVAREANFVVAATCCHRPMLFPETELIAQVTDLHMVLLRFDPGAGTSFDMLFRGSHNWLCGYLAWRRLDGDLWLIPSTTDGPFIRSCPTGLEQLNTPPFDSASERYAGLILARENPSFAGSL